MKGVNNNKLINIIYHEFIKIDFGRDSNQFACGL
jgi:hypothetical protein